MELWHIRGGRRLSGSCRVQGSKNATLPILAASLALPRRSELEGVPGLRDVDAALEILRLLGCRPSSGRATVLHRLHGALRTGRFPGS